MDDTDQPVDVRSVLDEIGAEESFARLEARLAELEQESARTETRLREHEQARRGELDVMRARLEDALDLVRETMDEQREAWSAFSERFTGLVEDAAVTGARQLDALRDELTPRVQRAVHHADELAAELRGNLDAVGTRATERAVELGRRVEALREELQRTADGLTATIADERRDRTSAIDELREGTAARLDDLAAGSRQRHEDVSGRIEALRRELDAAVGELRAGSNLKARELADALAELHAELGERLDEQLAGAVELERRWIDGTRDIARRIEHTEATMRRTLSEERAARAGVDDELAGRLDDVAGVVEDLHARFGTEVARRQAEMDQVRRDGADVASQIGALSSRVARALEQVASDLATRVATIAGDLDALREGATRQGQRLAGLERIETHLAELDGRLDEVVATSPVVDEERVQRLEVQVAALLERPRSVPDAAATADQVRALAASVAAISDRLEGMDGLRHEVRELASRTSELSTRVEASEELAGRAAQAIVSAVRKSRNRGGQREPGEPAPPVLMRDRDGKAIVGLDYLSARRSATEVEVEDLLDFDERDHLGGSPS